MDKTVGQAPIATLLVAALTIIIVIAGAVVMIVDPDTLSFEDYIKALATMGIGAGALGVGRGILAGAKQPGGFGAAAPDLLTPTRSGSVSPAIVAPPKDPPEQGGTTLHPKP
jgi:hypothetical protein